jgi:hypothetical protein
MYTKVCIQQLLCVYTNEESLWQLYLKVQKSGWSDNALFAVWENLCKKVFNSCNEIWAQTGRSLKRNKNLNWPRLLRPNACVDLCWEHSRIFQKRFSCCWFWLSWSIPPISWYKICSAGARSDQAGDQTIQLNNISVASTTAYSVILCRSAGHLSDRLVNIK